MTITGIIPARFASTRFPGKPLVEIGNKTMIRRVYEQASAAESLSRVVVATDDMRIADEVQNFGGEVMLTDSSHLNGTERCNEVVNRLTDRTDYVINIQGDEPFIQPEVINQLAGVLDGQTELGTLIRPVTDYRILNDPNSIKVVVNARDEAMYFSRSAIPFMRDKPLDQWPAGHTYYQHIGIYAYRTDILEKVTSLPAASLESAESLEQLRWLENGLRIKVARTTYSSVGIDVPEDLEKIKELLKNEQA